MGKLTMSIFLDKRHDHTCYAQWPFSEKWPLSGMKITADRIKWVFPILFSTMNIFVKATSMPEIVCE